MLGLRNKKNEGRDDGERQKDLEIFTIYDSKTMSYDVPTFAINEHDLVRQVINMFKDPAQKNNRYLLNAEDYSIFSIGSYEKRTGILTAYEPRHIANMHELRSVAQVDALKDMRDVQQQSINQLLT